MKLQHKLRIIILLFLGIILVNHSDCYAVIEDKKNIPSTIAGYEIFNSRLPKEGNFLIFLQEGIKYDYLYVLCSIQPSNHYVFRDTSSGISILSSPVVSDLVGSIVSTDISLKPTSYSGMNLKIDKTTQAISVFNAWTNYFSGIIPKSANYSVLYSTDKLYYWNWSTDFMITEYGSDEPDKLNLYELNMIDLDDNNKKHRFNISTYTNSPCYDEIMNYYNNNYQYAIYLTDYKRILTYQNYDDDNSFQYGSYVISGYMDYLITDKSFFYYSEYYQQVLSDSGNLYFDKDKENYLKRFYFKLTYSEDSNDPHVTIWANNGNLYKTDYLENFEDRYFVGSSQTIYYANENAKGKYKDLTKDIYYLGYLNPTNGKTRDISEIPFYVYNFDFAGGTTELYIINQNDYSYEEMINNRYNNWKENYDKWTIITDSSTGDSYIQGKDLTSSTFTKGTVTDDTTTENDKNYIGEIRTSSRDTDVIDEDKKEEANMTDGSTISNLINRVTDKFSFKDNMLHNANEIKDFITNTQETHKYYLNINHKYLKGNVCIIDLSWYAPYKETVDAFICAFAYLAFIWHMFCRIPNLINGASATSYLSDINTYIHRKGV